MKKVLTVLAWLGFLVSLMLLIMVTGQRNALIRNEKNAARKQTALQAQADEAQEQLKEMETERDALEKDKAALQQQLTDVGATLQAVRTEAARLTVAEQAAREALAAARQEWEAQRQAFAAEKDAAAGCLADALAALLPEVAGSDVDAPQDGENLFACQTPEEETAADEKESLPEEAPPDESPQTGNGPVGVQAPLFGEDLFTVRKELE